MKTGFPPAENINETPVNTHQIMENLNHKGQECVGITCSHWNNACTAVHV